jgi:hypothetical protein
MNRTLIAAALAVALIPSTALAGPRSTDLFQTRPLSCSLNKADGESLKVRMMVRNTSGRIISKGTNIRITIRTRYYSVTRNVQAWRDVAPGQSIGFDQPDNARYCQASVRVFNHAPKKFPR